MQTGKFKNSNTIYIFKITLVASVGGFLFGYDLVVIAGALPFLTDYFHLSSAMQGFAVSSAILGAVVGPVLGLWFSERVGRRKTMMVAALCFMISALGSALAITIWDFAFWRFLGGIGIGLAMMSSPIYIAELSPPDKRGRLVNVNQLSDVIGIILAVMAGYLFSFDGWGWRWMFGAEALPVVFLIVGLLFIPESPRWLATQNRFTEALHILMKINGKSIAEKELKEIQEGLQNGTRTYRNLFQEGGSKKALVIAIILMIFSQINGVNMILLYAPTILKNAGIAISSNAILSSIPIYIFIFICTILAFGLIKHFSRRRLLISSVLFMAIGHALMAINLQQNWPSLYTLLPMLIGAGAFTLGLAPLSWVITSEILPNRVRGKGLAIVCFFLYFSSFITAQLFPMVTNWFEAHFNNASGVYWIFCSICMFCVLFVWKVLPETKGLSLEEISVFWQKNNRNNRKKHVS